METIVMEAKQCPKCGRLMPPGVLAGLCPACLLAQGAETDAGEGGSTAPFQPPPLTEVARLFPQLEIIALLGAGGMGAVYKARQPGLDRFVALKVLPATNTSGVNFAERFNREARALARLSHPNIVAVHEFGQAGALHYFLMEFVDGANLRQLERAGRLSPREALQIIPQICDALQYAHDEGVVHRDIKPENVLVDRKGRVKIADFGLAKILGRDGEAARLTLEGQVMGTPHYMAPEQVERPLTVDHRADIYSLGVVFYEMLTGDLPLGKFAPPSRKVEVDVRLDEVVLRALENDPARRYQKASDVKSRVETISGSPPAASATGGPSEHLLYWAGFPLAVERDGQPKVNWKQTLLAFAVVFGLFSLAFAFVSVVTARSLMGWVGVIGWPSVIARLIIAALVVLFGVRRALTGPLPQDRRIPPAPWWRRRGPVAAAIVLLGVTWAFQNSSLPWRLGLRTSRILAQKATRDATTGTLVAQLPGRGTVELLAIGETNAGPGAWWAADGSILTNMDYEVRNPIINGGTEAGYFSRDVLLRIRNLPRGASMTGIQTGPESGVSIGEGVFRDGNPLDGALQARIAMQPATPTANIQVGFGLEPWRTIGTISADGRQRKDLRQMGDPKWKAEFYHEPVDLAEGVQVPLIFGPEDRMWAHRVVAVDRNDDVEHTAKSARGAGLEKVILWTYTFPGLRLAHLKEFRVQVRPVHWVEFSEVALQPRGTLPPRQPPTFGPVVQRRFTELIDFDTGMTRDFPVRGFSGSPTLEENTAWMKENRFDAAATSGEELRVLDMDFVRLKNSDWDTLSEAELVKRIYQNYYHPDVVTPENSTTTFGFRTREHGIGILQFVAFPAPGEPGLTLRYKLLQRANPNKAPRAPTLEASGRAAKATFAGTPSEIEEPPQLRFLAWQDEWKTTQPNGAWHSDGSPATNEADIALLRKLLPSIMDVSATEAGKRQPRFIHLWISQPLINQSGLNQVTLFDTDGAPIELGGDGSTASRVMAASDHADQMGWHLCTLSPGEGAKIPARVTIRFRYAVGSLEREQTIPSGYQGSMSLEGGSHLNGIGQDIEGNAFLAIAVDAAKSESRHFGAVAVTRDGQEIAASGNSTSGHVGSALRVEKFTFNTPLKEIAHFRVGTRPVRTTEWKDVVLLQNGQ
jgi:hypothetical protein